MKKYSNNALILGLTIYTFANVSNAGEYLRITADVTLDGENDEIMLTDTATDFYSLTVKSNNTIILKNDNLIPNKSIKNPGGIERFRGLSILNGSIEIDYYFCTPSSNVCYERKISTSYGNKSLVFSREEVIAWSEKLTTREIFYNKQPVLLEKLTYQYLLENNERASELFSSQYGSCIENLDNDSLLTITEELEKTAPNDWLFKDGCITPLLVIQLNTQGELSPNATNRYLSNKKPDTNAK